MRVGEETAVTENAARNLRYRQIHLDFHTSEHIGGIGARFDADEFADTLVRAHVDSITCFARCHHGWLYYESAATPERQHPHLECDLLREQIAACHARGIRVPIYTSVQWDHLIAQERPEWLARDEEGRPIGGGPHSSGFYRRLAVNSPYRDYLYAHLRDILETMPVDGLFLDIVFPLTDSSRWAQETMRAAGQDPRDALARRRFGARVIDEFRLATSAFIRQFNADCTIFYNRGHIGPHHRPSAAAFSHFEVESLPSGAWGYGHFPAAARFARGLGKPILGQTGKFHTAWGDFHSFKNATALEYECARMLAHGARCMIGDQLTPDGRIDPHVYALVAGAYERIARCEPYCEGSRPLADIGMLTPEEFAEANTGGIPPAIQGASMMMEEAAHQFDILDSQSDFAPYQVLILPDVIPVDDALRAKLESYLAGGGQILATFESGLNAAPGDGAQTAFNLPALGVSLVDEGPRDEGGQLARGRYYPKSNFAEYVLPAGPLAAGLPPTEHVMYARGTHIAAAGVGETLMHVLPAHFDRGWGRFCSHRQTPSAGQAGPAAAVLGAGCLYFSHPLFTQYRRNAPRWCRTLFLNGLRLLLPAPLIRHDGPSTLRAAIHEQAGERRRVLHLLHYIPERRGEQLDTIEDVIPLYGLGLSVRAERAPRAITTALGGEELPFIYAEGRVNFTLPRLEGHELVVLAD